MRGPSVTVRLSGDSWRFLLDTEVPALRAELRSILGGAQTLRVAEGDSPTWYVVGLTRLEALQLLEHVCAVRAGFPAGDSRYALSEQCIAAIGEGIRRSDVTR